MMFFRTIVFLFLSYVVLFTESTNGFPPKSGVRVEEGDPKPSQNEAPSDSERNHPGTDVSSREDDDEVTQLLNLADIYIREGKWDTAYGNIEEALKLEPDNAVALIRRGRVLLLDESDEEALKDFLRARRLADEQSAPVKLKLEAFDWLMRAHKAVNENEPLFAPIGEMMRIENLEEDAQWRLRANPCANDDESRTSTKDTKTLTSIGNRYFYEFEFDEALICYNKIIRMEDNVAKHYTNRALCHMRREDWNSAANDVARAMSIQPDNVRALFYSGFLNSEQAKYDVALDSLDKALQLADTTNAPLEEQEQIFALTEQVCAAAAKIMPNNLKIITILGRALIREQFYDLAIDLLIEGLDKAKVNNASSDENRDIQNLLNSAREKLFIMSKDGLRIERNDQIQSDEMRNQANEELSPDDPSNLID